MDRRVLVEKLEATDFSINAFGKELKDAGIELNEDGLYSPDDIEDRKLKTLAKLYNRLVDIRKKGIANLDKDDMEFLKDTKELSTGKSEEKEYSRSELIEELVKLNPGVEIRYQKEHDEVIYCSKNGSDLKLPEGFEYNDKNGVTNKHHTSSGRYTYVHVHGMENVPKDAVVVGKSEKKEKTEEKKATETKKKEKASKETKTETKGTFGEVVSCLFGQVDKRVSNYVAKHPKINNFFYNTRMNRYNHPWGYVTWRLLVSAPVAGVAFGMAAVQPWLIPVGVALSVFGGQAIGKFAVAIVRRATKNPPAKFKTVELKKGSYLENLKNAWNKFRNPKNVTKTNNAKVNAKPTEVKAKEEDSKDKANVESLVNAFTKAVSELDLNNVNLQKYDYCNNLYKTIENNGLLDKLSKETKEKYAQYERKVEEYKNLASAFTKKVNELDINNLNKELYDKCQFIYETMKEKFGEGIFKNVPSEVMNKFNEYGKTLTSKKETKEEKKEEPKIEDVINPYIQSLLQQMYIYDLKTTKDSVNGCEKLLNEIDGKIPETSNVRNNPKYSGLWRKYDHLKQSLVIKNKVLSFVEKVQNIKNSKNVSYTEFKECMDIVNSFGEAEWKDFDSLSNASAVLSDFQSILRNSREMILNQKLEELDIDKCINENNYGQLIEVVKLADDYEKEARDKHKAQPINKLSEKMQLKLERVRQIVSSFGKFNEYKLDVSLTVNQEDASIKAHYINYDGEEIELILDTKYTGSIEEVTRNVINEINAIEPLVSVDKINIHGLKYVKGASKGSHR